MSISEAPAEAAGVVQLGSVRLASGAFVKQINRTRYRKMVVLYRRADGAYVARYTSDPPSQRDRSEVLRRGRAQRLFAELPHKLTAWEEAFPPPQFTELRERAETAVSEAAD
jgi:hypothetical protein